MLPTARYRPRARRIFILKEVQFAITPPVDGALIDVRVRRSTNLFLRAVAPN